MNPSQDLAGMFDQWAPGYDESVQAGRGFPFSGYEVVLEKVSLLKRFAERHLSPDGFIVVGDVCFPTEQSLVEAQRLAGERWDESEYYWVAPEASAAARTAGLWVRHSQVSECGAVLVFGPEGMP